MSRINYTDDKLHAKKRKRNNIGNIIVFNWTENTIYNLKTKLDNMKINLKKTGLLVAAGLLTSASFAQNAKIGSIEGTTPLGPSTEYRNLVDWYRCWSSQPNKYIWFQP
ncbi:hypothetical protein ACFX5U_03635 [Sphingobacterium sp. SG20118]|uniref:hypothetical protein n=1 Tax=Sphingobacterium sp. SG20118 TaxID=3367156 RepID=UPI0037DFC828